MRILTLFLLLLIGCGTENNSNNLGNNQNNENNENNSTPEVDLGPYANNTPGFQGIDSLVIFGIDYHTAVCERLITCRDEPSAGLILSFQSIGTFEGCVTKRMETQNPNRWRNLENLERVAFLRDQYPDCLDFVRKIPCGDFAGYDFDQLESIPECNVVVGKSPDGRCQEAFECPDGQVCSFGLECNGNCVENACDCDVDELCLDDVCEPRIAEGAACERLGFCALGSECLDGTCQPIELVDNDCDIFSKPCTAQKTCLSGECLPIVGVGESCGESAACDAHLICVGGVCERRNSGGATCEINNECRSFDCNNGTCTRIDQICNDDE